MVSHVLNAQPPTYCIKDLNDEGIQVSFYKPEFWKDQDLKCFEKVFLKQTKDGVKEVFVQLKRYTKSFNSLINLSWFPW